MSFFKKYSTLNKTNNPENLTEILSDRKPVMVIKKIDMNERKDIKLMIDRKFNDVNEFLEPDEKLIIGKKIIKFTDRKFTNIKPYHVIGNIKLFDPKPRYGFLKNSVSKKDLKFSKSVFSSYLNTLIKPAVSHLSNKETITEDKLTSMYESLRNKKSSKEQVDIEIVKNVEPQCAEEIKNILIKQEKILNQKFKSDNYLNTLSKFLSNKTKKKEDELLINRSDGFRIQKEMKMIFEDNSLRNTKYGFSNDWVFSLRNSSNDKSFNYLNCHNTNNQLWATVNESNEKANCSEKVRKPFYLPKNEFINFANNTTISSKIESLNIRKDDLVKISNMKVNFF